MTTHTAFHPSMRVAYFTHYQNWLCNQMFDAKSECNVNNVLDRWIALKHYLGERGIELNTYDMSSNVKPSLWLVHEPLPAQFKFMLKHGVNPRKTILMITEPRVVNPWGWRNLKYYSWLFKAVLTWNSQLCETRKGFFHFHFPVRITESMRSLRATSKKKLCVMVHANKTSAVDGELYSFRRAVIRHYEEDGSRLLDLFGHRWNTDASESPYYSSLYQGVTEDKLATLAQYYFVFCIDNCIQPGYITYDPLLSMAVGSVPIYLPMPDSTRFIPADTFIDLSKFSSLNELTCYLHEIVENGRYDEYRRKGREFLDSPLFEPFSINRFCEDVYAAIVASI